MGQEEQPIERPTYTGFKRIRNAITFSMKGLETCFIKEEAFRQETLIAAIFIPIALLVGETITEKILLIGSVILVLIVELLNSAIECTVDRISLEDHHLSEKAKDMGSAAVFLTLVLAVIIWSIIVFSKLL